MALAFGRGVNEYTGVELQIQMHFEYHDIPCGMHIDNLYKTRKIISLVEFADEH
jgi:hypothetical protein